MAEERSRASSVGRRQWRPQWRWSIWLRLTVLGLGTFALTGSRGTAGGWADEEPTLGIGLAQREETRISVAETILAEAASEIAIRIEVGPSWALPKNCFIRLRGLPPTVSLTEGHSIGPGSWAIPLFGLAKLKANVPAGAAGRSELLITLVDIDGLQIAETKSALIVGSGPILAASEKMDPLPQQQRFEYPPLPMPAVRPDRNDNTTSQPSEPTAEEKDHIANLAAQGERYVVQGEQYLSEGNVAVARQFFQRAADAGYAPGAMRLAATYDPDEFSPLPLQGIVADRALARKWYERARELGAPGADARLARLGRK